MDDYKKYIEIILEMKEEDQEARSVYVAGLQNPERYNEIVAHVDKKNESTIEEIIGTVGWPTISKVGTEASTAFWLLVQHAKIDLKKKGLELMEKCLDDIDMKNYAYLKDRVLLMDKKPQIYGTQVAINLDTNSTSRYP